MPWLKALRAYELAKQPPVTLAVPTKPKRPVVCKKHKWKRLQNRRAHLRIGERTNDHLPPQA
jgi:hypothetical protein